MADKKNYSVNIFTDGACLGNPGPGGYAYILLYAQHEKKGSAGYRLTTNNRMELRAVIEGLRQLKKKCSVTVFSDSKYVCDAINKKWLEKWDKNGWRSSDKKPVKNKDLWIELKELLNGHSVIFEWLKGHAGNKYNELCDQLANSAAIGKNLMEDINYSDEKRI